jgi:membrane protease YdiL (CAAX protease family)
VAATITFLAIQLSAPLQRLANFAKSTWPADRGFVALMLGSILLLMAQSMGSWNAWLHALLQVDAPDSRFAALEASSFLNLTMFFVYFAGASAFFVCFFPGTKPSRRLARWVYLPVAIGLAANFATVLRLSKLDFAVPWPNSEPFSWTLNGFATALHAPGLGIWSALLATVLVLYADLRIRSGHARLPVHFAPTFAARPDGSPDGQVNRFIWMSIALILLTAFAAFPAYYLDSWIHDATVHGESGRGVDWKLVLHTSGQIWQAVALVLLICVAMGSARRETLKQSLRIPSVINLGLGIALPTVVLGILPALQYVFDRIHWAAYDFGRSGPPVFLSYFLPLPRWPALFMLLGVLVEEIGWRGYLQPRFISRYGLYRGIFLVGVVWAVFHFPGDSYWSSTSAQILIHSTWRLLNCISVGFALSWLTLRSRSVWPAALAHGTSNALLTSGFGGLTSRWIVILVWIVIDLLLFRFWPPDANYVATPEPTPEDPPQHLPQLLDSPS